MHKCGKFFLLFFIAIYFDTEQVLCLQAIISTEKEMTDPS